MKELTNHVFVFITQKAVEKVDIKRHLRTHSIEELIQEMKVVWLDTLSKQTNDPKFGKVINDAFEANKVFDEMHKGMAAYERQLKADKYAPKGIMSFFETP